MLVWCIHGGRCVTCASVNYWWQCRRGQFSGPIMKNMNVAFDTSRLILWGPDYAEWLFCNAMLIMSSACVMCCQWWCVIFVWHACHGIWCLCDALAMVCYAYATHWKWSWLWKVDGKKALVTCCWWCEILLWYNIDDKWYSGRRHMWPAGDDRR
jgi:hypothetical protein